MCSSLCPYFCLHSTLDQCSFFISEGLKSCLHLKAGGGCGFFFLIFTGKYVNKSVPSYSSTSVVSFRFLFLEFSSLTENLWHVQQQQHLRGEICTYQHWPCFQLTWSAMSAGCTYFHEVFVWCLSWA